MGWDLKTMRTTSIALVAAAATLGLSACSEKTQDHASDTASSAANDVAGSAAEVGQAASTSADAVGNAARDAVNEADKAADKAADRASIAADKMGAHIKQGAAEAEAALQNEPVAKAKKD